MHCKFNDTDGRDYVSMNFRADRRKHYRYDLYDFHSFPSLVEHGRQNLTMRITYRPCTSLLTIGIGGSPAPAMTVAVLAKRLWIEIGHTLSGAVHEIHHQNSGRQPDGYGSRDNHSSGIGCNGVPFPEGGAVSRNRVPPRNGNNGVPVGEPRRRRPRRDRSHRAGDCRNGRAGVRPVHDLRGQLPRTGHLQVRDGHGRCGDPRHLSRERRPVRQRGRGALRRPLQSRPVPGHPVQRNLRP